MYTFINENTVAANVSAFVIPNRGGLVSNFGVLAESKTKTMTQICEMNGQEFDPENDKLFEVWIHSNPDLYCDNMNDHSFVITNPSDGKEYYFRLPFSYLPEKLFRGKKEGDTVVITVPLTSNIARCTDDCDDWNINLQMTVKLDQRTSRYRRFGDFEEVLKSVV